MSTIYDDMNPEWAEGVHEQPQWEPWKPADEWELINGEIGPEYSEAGCYYCGALDELRDQPDPFGQQVCCEACFLQLIGDDRDGEPFRCSRAGDL